MADPANPANPAPLEPQAPPPPGYAPYGQLVKMLLPSSGSITLYSAEGELLWCSMGYERPELRALVDRALADGAPTFASNGRLEKTSTGASAFLAGLRAPDGRPLGAVLIELGPTAASRYSGSMIAGLVRPVLDCLENRMNLERTVLGADDERTAELELLLGLDDEGHDDTSALERVLEHCGAHLDCAAAALVVPDKNIAVSWSGDHRAEPPLLDRAQRHLLAWAELNNRPMVANRLGAGAAYKILSCPLRDAHNRVIGVAALFRATSAPDFALHDVRILELVCRKAIAVLASQHDALTGLDNRLIFERRAARLLDAAEPKPSALLYFDVDKLAVVNEAFGLQAGDEVIERVAEVLRGRLGARGLLCRIGGDRFAAFLEIDPGAALKLAESLAAALGELGYLNGDEAVPVSACVGVALGSRQERIEHLLASAELACKRAKRLGRGRVALHEDPTVLALRRGRQSLAAASLHEALKSNEFRLDVQPVIGLQGVHEGVTVGHELLIRMRSPAGEMLAPDKFLAAAEHYDILPALDRWVVCSAVAELRGGAAPAPTSYIALNVSRQSVASRQYARFVLEQLAEAGLEPSRFCFEIKETAALSHLEEAEAFVRELREAGCRVGLDDFGHGLSSLAHLQRLPIGYLKIDGGLVRRVLDDRIAASIVSGIARAAKTLGVATIAKHVESPAIAEQLRGLEVEFGQGFFLGRPQPFTRPHPAAQPVAATS